jgi:cell pole-organizing protein PopZ
LAIRASRLRGNRDAEELCFEADAREKSAMTQAAKAQEPSMEEILASIRRIIADDDANKAAAKPAERAPPPRQPPDEAAPPPPAGAAPPAAPPAPHPTPGNSQSDIDAMLAEIETPKPDPHTPPAPKPTPSAPCALELTEAIPAPPPPPSPAPVFRTINGDSDVVFTDRPANPEPPPRAAEEPRRPGAQRPQLTERALLSTAASAAVDGAFNALANTLLLNNSRTLEDLVKDMLRPMLKTWLDDNLPGLVERIVRSEIERVSRGRP